MERKSLFTIELRKLLLQKIKDKELKLPEEKIRYLEPLFQEVDGKMRYFIETSTVETFNENIIKDIEYLWSNVC